MISTLKMIGVTALLLYNSCFAQQMVRLPVNLKRQLKLQCTICSQHPYDSTRIIASTDKAAITAINFHNSVTALINGDLDDSYTYTLNTIAQQNVDKEKYILQYAYFIKAKVLYYKKLYTAAAEEYLRLLTMTHADEVIRSNIYTNLGEIYMQLKDFTRALKYFDTWQLLYAPNAEPYSIKAVYQNKGLCFFYLGQYKEAEESYTQTIKLATELHDTAALAISYANLANFYYNQLLDNKAIPSFEQSLFFAQRSGDIEILKDANLNMAVIEENRNRPRQALTYRKQYEKLQDSIWNRDNIWKLTSQERKFDAKLNENKILMLEQQATIRNNELKVRNWQRNTFFAAAILFLMLSAAAYWAYRLKAQKNSVILKQKEELDLLGKTKDRLYSVVAHDLRSPVYSLKASLVNVKTLLLQNMLADADIALSNAQATASNAYTLLDNLLHWVLSQTNQLFFRAERMQLSAIVKQVCYDYTPFAVLKNIRIEQRVSSNIYLEADISSFKIILRNLLDNAIKYTPPNGFITLSSTINENKCCLQVKDTGIGMNDIVLKAVFGSSGDRIQQDVNGFTSTGIGLGLCKMIAEKNNCDIQIHSEKGNGTLVEIYFSLIA